MTTESMLGRVVVVAGTHAVLAAVARAAIDAGAMVAVVSPSLDVADATVLFRADPTTAAVWERVAMHVEQHLGPVDGVVTDEDTAPTITPVFAPDLARRGHGDVIVADAESDLAAVVKQLGHTPAAAPPRSRGDAARP